MKIDYLHIYGPAQWHDHSFIVGNRESLQALRDAIDSALAEGSGKVSEVCTSDCEGFDLHVYKEDSESFWNKAATPYTDELAREARKDTIGPWDLFRKHK